MGSVSDSTGAVERGAVVYTTCAGCHGASGEGIPGHGVNLAGSAFVQEMSDEELLEFVKAGRSADDPSSLSGVEMPPLGGNPSLSDSDLYDVVAFIRTLPAGTSD